VPSRLDDEASRFLGKPLPRQHPKKHDTMEQQYGATDDANAPVPKVEEPQNANRARKAIAAIALTSSMMWAATATTTGKREVPVSQGWSRATNP
jgi:hypothetical protein